MSSSALLMAEMIMMNSLSLYLIPHSYYYDPHLTVQLKFQELASLLDSSEQGVVYWSFGSMSRIETIPVDTLRQMFAAIADLPQNVLVKMNRAYLPPNVTVPDNIYTMNWIPQYKTLCKFKPKAKDTILIWDLKIDTYIS